MHPARAIKNGGSPTITRRAFVQRAAIMLGSLITVACSANKPVSNPPTVKPPVAPSPTPASSPPALPSPIPAQTLYVNMLHANAGDANPGTIDRPLKTVAKAAGIALENNLRNIGTTVIIFPGVYRESLSLQPKDWHANAPIQFQARENGTAIITGSDIWTEWRKQGTTNVYTHHWPYKWGMAPIPSGWVGHVEVKPIVRRREMVFVNGVSLTQVLSNRDLKEGTFYVSEQSSTISLIPPPGVAVENATIEVAVRAGTCTVEGGQNVTVRGLVFRHGNTPLGEAAVVFIGCNNIVVEDCQFFWNNWAGVTFVSSPSRSAHAMIARRNIANYNGAIGMAASYIKDLLYEDNETSFNNWRGALGGFDGWASAGMKHLYIHGGTYRRHRAMDNLAPGCWFDTDCTEIEIDQSFSCGNGGAGLFLEASEGPIRVTGSTICHNLVDGGIFSEGASDVTLQGNIIYGNAISQIRVFTGVRPVTNWETNEGLAVIVERWTLRKNMIVGTDATPHLVTIGRSAGENKDHFLSTLASDANIWFSPKGNEAFDINDKKRDFTTWQSTTKQDSHSQFIDPQFVNPENDDFDLRATSPLRGK